MAAAPALKSRMKKTPPDVWSTRERLCLASSVLRSGDQNWVSVSRTIKSFGEPNRPADWFSQKNCALQYADLLENVDTPKRKRGDRGEIETPGEAIVRKLTQERISELKAITEGYRQTYKKLKLDIQHIKEGRCDDKLAAMLQECIDEKKQVLEESNTDSRTQEQELPRNAVSKSPKTPTTSASVPKKPRRRTWSRRSSSQSDAGSESEAVDSPVDVLQKKIVTEDPTPVKDEMTQQLQETEQVSIKEPIVQNPQPPMPTSPLLTSLLKNPIPSTCFPGLHTFQPKDSAIPNKTQNDTSEVAETVSQITPETNILISPKKIEPSDSTEVASSNDEISNEQLSTKSIESPKIEKQSNLNDVLQEAEVDKMEEEVNQNVAIVDEIVESVKIEPEVITEEQNIASPIQIETTHDEEEITENDESVSVAKTGITEEEVEVAATEQVEEIKKEPSALELTPAEENVVEMEVDIPGEQEVEVASAAESGEIEETVTEAETIKDEVITKDEKSEISAIKEEPIEETAQAEVTQSFETPSVHSDDTSQHTCEESTPAPVVKAEPTRGIRGKRGRGSRKSTVVHQQPTQPDSDSLQDDTSKQSDLNEKSECSSTAERETIETSEETNTVEEKEDKEPVKPPEERVRGRKRKDDSKVKREDEAKPKSHRSYERKLIDEEKGRGRRHSFTSESKTLRSGKGKEPLMPATPSDDDEERGLAKSGLFPLDSIPNSPASTSHSDDPDSLRDYKLWKKAIMLVWRSAATHKFANVFLHPVTEEVAPGYSSVVYRSMDLSHVKKNIENGQIKTTAEFQRDMMLMFQNAIMYNSSDHDVYHMAVEMQKEVEKHIQDFLATQLMVQAAEMPKNLRRETRELSQKRTTEQRSERGQSDDFKRSFSSSETDGSKMKKKRTRAVDD